MTKPVPHYKTHLFFCVNQRAEGETCCNNAKASDFREYAKTRIKALGLDGPGKVRVNMAGCMGRCAQGPTLVIYPEGVWYTYHTHADIDEIIEKHVCKGEIVERLLMPSIE